MSTGNDQRRIPPCEHCGGAQIGGLNLVSYSFTGLHPWRYPVCRPMTELNAAVCLGCGQIKMVASDLEKLRQEAHDNPETFVW